MAEIGIYPNSGWSYSGTGKELKLITFKNPSSSEKAELSKVRPRLGTVNGRCAYPGGDIVVGNGSSFSTYLSINGIKSKSQTINNVVGVTNDSNKVPIKKDCKEYTFVFDPVISIPAGGSVDIKIKCPVGGDWSGGQCLGFDNNSNVIVVYQNIPNISRQPTEAKIECTSFTDVSIDWKTTTRLTTDIRVFLDSKLQLEKSTNGHVTNRGTFSVARNWDPEIGTHSLQVSARNDNSAWLDSDIIHVDCTYPTIFSAKITPVTQSTGILSFHCNYDVEYYLDGKYIGQIKAQQDPNVTVQLSNGANKTYTLLVKRLDNTVITNSTVIGADTTPPVIVLTGKLSGTQYTITAKADSICYDWYYTFNELQIVASVKDTDGFTATIPNLTPGEMYTITAYAKKRSNGIQGQSNTLTAEANGTVRLFEDNTYKTATMFVHTNGQWKMCLPYVKNNGNWKLGI